MSQPTIYEGDVLIKSSNAPSIFGAGSLEVTNNLLVSGTESSHQVDNFYTSDNIIGVNEPPIPGRDLGLLATRHPTDILAGNPTDLGTSTSATLNTITLDTDANITNNYYNEWLISITSGPGIGETNKIISYVGATRVATVDTNWTTPPTASDYDIFGNRQVGLIWSESNQKMQLLGTTLPHTSLVVPNANQILDLEVGKIVQELAEECIYYVGTHGNDTNTGFHIIEAKLTFGGALAAAIAETPSVSNQITIICFDNCSYTENITIPSWIHIHAQSASLIGTISIADQSSVHFATQTVSAGTIGVTSSGTSIVTINKMNLSGNADGVLNTGTNLTFRSDILSVDSGVAFTNNSAGSSNVDIKTINTLATSVAISELAGTINGTIGQILGAGLAFNVIGTININASNINTPLAYNIAATGVLNLYTGSINGTQVIALGGIANVLPAGLLTAKGDLYTREIVGTDNKIVRFPSSADGTILYSDSTQSTGLRWGVAPDSEKNITISSMQIIAYSLNPLPIGYFDWVNHKYTGSIRRIHYESFVPVGKSLTVAIYNESIDPTYTTPLGTQTLIGPLSYPNAFKDFTFTRPGGSSSFTGSISGTILTVTAIGSGSISVGQSISGGSILSGTYIVNQLSGTTFTVNLSQIVGSSPITGSGADARLAICVSKTPVGGVNPSVYGVTMILTP